MWYQDSASQNLEFSSLTYYNYKISTAKTKVKAPKEVTTLEQK
jgi:hypothetical protein